MDQLRVLLPAACAAVGGARWHDFDTHGAALTTSPDKRLWTVYAQLATMVA